MRTYKKNRRSRAKSSYESYLKNREEWKRAGYSLDEALTKKNYDNEFIKAKKLGIKNIAREFAKADRTMTLSFARDVVDVYNKITGKEYTAKELLSLEFEGFGDRVEYESKGEKKIRYRTNREALYLFLRKHGEEEDVYGY